MTSLADLMKGVNATIFDAIGEVMLVGATPVPGIYNAIPLDDVVGDSVAVGTVRHEFHCQHADVLTLVRGTAVEVKASPTGNSFGAFIVRRVQKPDETGRTIIELNKA